MYRTLFCILIAAYAAVSCAFPAPGHAAGARQPNLIVIHTDEHNFRTLGCYREQLTPEQAFIWGAGVCVETPHIDRIAREGAICTRFYAASPVCTPSRASLMTGRYPQATGAYINNQPMKDEMVTFAEALRRNGYHTAYLGKWHLDGTAKPGWHPERKFGFVDNRFMFNRGHWKVFRQTADGAEVATSSSKKKNTYSIEGANDKTYATDFLTDRALEIIDQHHTQPFCVMLSLPDPHGPNTVRAPYDQMFDHFRFEQPKSMQATLANPTQVPKWNVQTGANRVTQVKQSQMARYFGMVKCIDDNVGRILAYLDKHDLADNTIVVFTSDHGDLMCEHCRLNKGLPYETSAKIPFVMRYPEKIRSGKVIETAHLTTDFAPTVLSLMGVGIRGQHYDGVDMSPELTSSAPRVRGNRIAYFRNAAGRWVAAVNERYKLVLSEADRPWLFDLEQDPDELINFFENPDYRATAETMMDQLRLLMKQYDEPALQTGKLRYQ